MLYKIVLAFFCYFITIPLKAEEDFKISPTFEALKSGGFRVFMPSKAESNSIIINANINKEINSHESGLVYGRTNFSENGYLILNFGNKLKVGDVVKYWMRVTANGFGYQQENEWKVVELLNQYSTLAPICVPSITVQNGRTSICVDDVIIDDDFNGPAINHNLWIVEQRIPTYVPPTYEFNSYECRVDNCFFKNNILFLKPVMPPDAEIRGKLDLRKGCTATDNSECYYESVSVFYLPPVKSARITSKASFKYGKVDIRARLPAGDWIFPIIQLQPVNSNGQHPPRVFIAYSRGNEFLKEQEEPYREIGSHYLYGGPVVYSLEPEKSTHFVSQRHNTPHYNDFHVYTLEWKQDEMSFYVDGNLYGNISLHQNFSLPHFDVGTSWKTPTAPFNDEYVLSLGVAVGGQYDFPDGSNSKSGQKPWMFGDRSYLKNFYNAKSNWTTTWIGDNTALQIDYVKVTAI